MEPTNTPAGRQGVTFEQVAAIADAIAAQGNRPTLRGVRAELGTGSLGTIQKHLAAWQGTRRQIVTSSATLPTEIQRVILGEIERTVSEARAELEADLAAAMGDRDALTDDNLAQSEQIELQAARLAEVEAGSQQQAGRILQLETDLATAAAEIKRERDEAANGRQALARAELRLEQLPLLQAEAERLRSALDAASVRATTAEQSAAVGAAQLDALRDQLCEVREARARIESERDQAREFAHLAQGEAKEQARRIQDQGATIEALRADLAKSAAEGGRLNSALALALAQIDAKAAQVAAEPPAAAPEFALESSPLIESEAETTPVQMKKAPAKRRTPPPPAA
jgi:colicin import membrane protein